MGKIWSQQTPSPDGADFQQASRPTQWQCGHCGFGLLSTKYDEFCTNTNCGRHKDIYAREYSGGDEPPSSRPRRRQPAAPSNEHSASLKSNVPKTRGRQRKGRPRENRDVESVFTKKDDRSSLSGETLPVDRDDYSHFSDETLYSVSGNRDDNSAHPGKLSYSFLAGKEYRPAISEDDLQSIPASLRPVFRSVLSLPSDRINFSKAEGHSLCNKFKTLAENISQAKWCWYPLRPRMRFLEKGETRMHWQCHCDRHLWIELSTSHAELIKTFLARRNAEYTTDHICGPWSHQISWIKDRILHWVQTATLYGSERQGQSSSTGGNVSSQMQLTPTGPGGSAQKSQDQDISVSQTSSTDQHQVANSVIDVQGIDQSVILLGVRGSRITLELAQINMLKYSRDDVFFSALKQRYRECRGRLRYWLSVWRLSHCDFVKLEKIWADTIIYRGKDLPTDSIYDYTPRPPHADDPPISPHEFEAAFAACGSRCMLARFHDCSRVPATYFATNRIPKRKGNVEMKTHGREYVWGLQAQHAISFLFVLSYHVVILGGAISFWIWWLINHPGDLQSASVPVSVSITLLSLFWSSAGILKGSRETA